MESTGRFAYRIEVAKPEELSDLLNARNRESFQEYNWDMIAVRASYSDLIDVISELWRQNNLYLDYGNRTMEKTNGYVYDTMQAVTNLKIAYDFFCNPPVVENPNSESLKPDIESIDWSKPVYTSDEIKAMLNISDNTFRKWINGGWISYTQIAGSDKKFIQKEHLLEFLNNPKIFYPSSK